MIELGRNAHVKIDRSVQDPGLEKRAWESCWKHLLHSLIERMAQSQIIGETRELRIIYRPEIAAPEFDGFPETFLIKFEALENGDDGRDY